MKRTALSTIMGTAQNLPSVHQIGKPTRKPTTVVSSPARRVAKVLQTSFNPTAPDVFTEDDFLIIDFVNEEGTGPHGDFVNKVKNRCACWEMTYRIRTIPAAYFATEELREATLASAVEDFDEYELFYVHQSYCDHTELNRIVKDILINFIDPKTYLLAAQVKIQPLNLSDFLEKHGTFGTPFTPGGDYEIDYWYQAGQYENWDLERRPLTSSLVPYNP